MDRCDRRRERPAERAAARLSPPAVVPRLCRRDRRRCIVAVWRIVHSPFGRVLQALRDNEQRAREPGLQRLPIKLGAFVSHAVHSSATRAALLTLMLQGVYANNLSWQHAGDSLLMAVLGGVHHFLGPLWGAITFIVLRGPPVGLTENWWLIFAPILMLFALLSPGGHAGPLQRLRRPQQLDARAPPPSRRGPS